eukprot:XP_013995568.1 PREDICTED: uncharacterized protein LOC106569105 [Salmo salar]
MKANISLKMEKSISVMIILIMTTGMVSGDSVTPDKEEYTPTEGSSVSLRCTYETSSEYIYLYWFRHYSNQAPQFLLYKGARSWSSEEHIPDKRYTSTTSSTSTELVITSLTLADTALYYCALDTLTRDTPQYVLRRDRYSEGSNSDEFKKRFDARLNFTYSSVPLTIQRLQLSDSAVYYCALKPTVTTKCRGEDTVTQPPGDVISIEGGQVTLDCQFETSDTTNLNMFWYKYEANDFPKFMLGRFSFGSINATEFEERFDAHLKTDSKSVPLTIQRFDAV